MKKINDIGLAIWNARAEERCKAVYESMQEGPPQSEPINQTGGSKKLVRV